MKESIGRRAEGGRGERKTERGREGERERGSHHSSISTAYVSASDSFYNLF